MIPAEAAAAIAAMKRSDRRRSRRRMRVRIVAFAVGAALLGVVVAFSPLWRSLL